MYQIVIIVGSLVLVYISRIGLTAELGRLVRRFGGGNRAFVILWSIIFLPGTIIHEMSHFFAAAFTGTRIGNVEIFPSLPESGIGVKDQPKSVHLGFVQTQQLGLIRGFLVGTAPFLVGLGLLVWLSASLSSQFSVNGLRVTNYELLDLLKVYFFFTVANSLFPSWTDLKYALPMMILGIIGAGGAYLLGFRIDLIQNARFLSLLISLRNALIISLGINLTVVGVFWIGRMAFNPRGRH